MAGPSSFRPYPKIAVRCSRTDFRRAAGVIWPSWAVVMRFSFSGGDGQVPDGRALGGVRRAHTESQAGRTINRQGEMGHSYRAGSLVAPARKIHDASRPWGAARHAGTTRLNGVPPRSVG